MSKIRLIVVNEMYCTDGTWHLSSISSAISSSLRVYNWNFLLLMLFRFERELLVWSVGLASDVDRELSDMALGIFVSAFDSVALDFLGLELVDDSDSVWLLLPLWVCSLFAKSSQHVYFIQKRIILVKV